MDKEGVNVMRKKWKKALIIGVGIIVIVLIFMLLGMKKTEWNESASSYGVLEGVEGDYFPIDENKEYRITGNLYLLKGSVEVTYRINDEVVFEKTYEAGNHKLEEYVFEKCGGEFCIEWQVSDDAEGSYDFTIDQRQWKITKWMERIEENIK